MHDTLEESSKTITTLIIKTVHCGPTTELTLAFQKIEQDSIEVLDTQSDRDTIKKQSITDAYTVEFTTKDTPYIISKSIKILLLYLSMRYNVVTKTLQNEIC